jgi:hypothetical protein
MNDAGIYLRGVVSGRMRKAVDDRYRYTYIVDGPSGPIRVTVWGEHEHIPIGTSIEKRVVVRPYLNSKNTPMFSLSFADLGERKNGEETF